MSRQRPSKRPQPCKVMCGTCPFREGSPYAVLQDMLTQSALTETSRICHSTGGPNAIHPKGTGKPALICRGTRDVQLKVMTVLNVIAEPTDEAWETACEKRGL